MAFTLDLPEDENRALESFCFHNAPTVGAARLHKVTVIRQLLHQLQTDSHTRETLVKALREQNGVNDDRGQ